MNVSRLLERKLCLCGYSFENGPLCFYNYLCIFCIFCIFVKACICIIHVQYCHNDICIRLKHICWLNFVYGMKAFVAVPYAILILFPSLMPCILDVFCSRKYCTLLQPWWPLVKESKCNTWQRSQWPFHRTCFQNSKARNTWSFLQLLTP